MTPVKQITIERAEGPCDLCVEKTFTDWDSARSWMYRQGHTFPKGGGYDKHDLKVEWQDGTVIGCRMDAKNTHEENNGLDAVETVWLCVSFYSGIRKPSHMTEEHYKQYLAAADKEWLALCKKVAETCDLSFFNAPKVR